MASTYVHVGDVKEIPEDALAGLRFLASYISALDSSSHETRTAHFSPAATIKTNNEAPLPFADMSKMFELRDQMTHHFSHVVNRAWIVTESADRVTILLDWSSTTVFKENLDKPAEVPEFSVLKLSNADEGKGINGYWVDTVENWMDVSPVKAVRDEIIAEASLK